MKWREEFARSLLQLGNFAVLALLFNAVLNPAAQWYHFVEGIGIYIACLLVSYHITRRS